MLSKLKTRFPWWAKLSIKIVLSRIPLAYAAWQRIGLFRHGHMDSAEYAIGVFESHLSAASIEISELKNKTVLEIGPGDSIASAIIAHAYGAQAILIDAGPFASNEIQSYFRLRDLLASKGHPVASLSGAKSTKDILDACNAQYLAEGLRDWSNIPSSIVDFVFSQAVLEHIRRHEFLPLQKECFRVMKDGAVASHRVDLRDHLGGSLNNLRFTDRVWESDLFSQSGFYTNRIQMSKMLELFTLSGFEIKSTETRRWDKLPISRDKLDAEFGALSDEKLNVSGFDVVLVKPKLCVV